MVKALWPCTVSRLSWLTAALGGLWVRGRGVQRTPPAGRLRSRCSAGVWAAAAHRRRPGPCPARAHRALNLHGVRAPYPPRRGSSRPWAAGRPCSCRQECPPPPSSRPPVLLNWTTGQLDSLTAFRPRPRPRRGSSAAVLSHCVGQRLDSARLGGWVAARDLASRTGCRRGARPGAVCRPKTCLSSAHGRPHWRRDTLPGMSNV